MRYMRISYNLGTITHIVEASTVENNGLTESFGHEKHGDGLREKEAEASEQLINNNN